MAGVKIILFTIFVIFVVSNFFIPIYSHKPVIILSEDNWDSMLNGEWMVEFYAPWCPACKALQPVWNEFSNWKADLGINVAKVDVTTSPGLSGRFLVTALPTIFHVFNGEFRQYRGGRDKDSLISFIEDSKWKEIEPISPWKSPGSFQMSVVAYFFKLSTVLRSLHSKMIEEYGVPTWGSYTVFAAGTIFIGAMLGLVLVCIIDCIYPPRSSRPSPLAPLEETDEIDETDDLIDEGAESGAESRPETQSEAEDSQEDVREDSDDDEDDDNGRTNTKAESEGEMSPTMRKRKPRKAD